MELKITTLIENDEPDVEGLINEFGLSFLIETKGRNILFDVGQTGDFVKNAEKLEKDLNLVDYVVLSHGHFDHVNGVPTFMNKFSCRPTMFIGDGFFYKKYKQLQDGTYIDGSVSFTKEQIEEKGFELITLKDNLHYIEDDIVIFYNFERTNSIEELRDEFQIKKGDSYVLDEFKDEIALGIITSKGLVVVVGCSHVGIVNILTTIEKRMHMPIYAVIGGTHLVDADKERIQYSIDEFEKMNIHLFALSHCTGQLGEKMLQETMKERFTPNNTGTVFTV